MSEPPQPLYHHIAFAADRNFSVPLGLACLSLMRATPVESLYHIHILGVDVEEHVIEQITTLCEGAGYKISYHDVAKALDNVASTSYFPSVAFGRFLLPDLLPADVERVVYSDSDVMICRDLADLYELEMGEHLLAAVQELAPVWNTQFAANHARWTRYFELSEQRELYCYSGLIVFNLPACREAQLSASIIAEASRAGDQLAYPDQDIMNGICRGRIMPLPQCYCMIPHLHAYYTTRAKEVLAHPDMLATDDELREAAHTPCIIHFASSSKPFLLFPPSGGNAAFYSLWLSSPWRYRLPYLPHRMLHGIREWNSTSMKLLARLLTWLTYIPGLYPLWWKLARHAPLTWKKIVADFFQWRMPEE